jgi:GT2 family glycosyltransferase
MVASKILYAEAPHLIDSAGIEVSRTGLAWNRYNRTQEDALEVEPYEVFGPSAAAALYRRTMLDDVGLFDESYFAYYEDVDLAWRARLLGWRCLYVPTARVYHVHSATSRQGSPFKRYFLVRNKVWTTLKNYPAPAVWSNLPIILLYDLASDFYRMILERNLSPLQGQIAALGRLSVVLRQRKAIQHRRRVSWKTLRKSMIPPPNLLKSLWHRRRVGENKSS